MFQPKYFEDYEIGSTRETLGRTITRKLTSSCTLAKAAISIRIT